MKGEVKGLQFIQNNNLYTLNKVIEDNSRFQEATIIANAAKKNIEQHGSNVTLYNFEQLTIAAQVLLSNITLQDKTVVLPLECGLGKSTLIEEFLKYKIKHDPEFGAVVVKERVEDCIELEHKLDGHAIAVYSFHKNYCKQELKEYDRVKCKNCLEENCKIKETPQKQIEYPIAIISSERFRLMMLYKKNLGDFIYYKDINGIKRRRNVLIIDEKPALTVNKALDIDKLEKIEHAYLNIDENSPIFDEANNFLDYIDKIERAMRRSTKQDFILQPLNAEFSLSTSMKLHFEEYYRENDIESLEFVLTIIKNGGVVRKGNIQSDIENEIYTIDYIKPDYRIKNVIFDATATFDCDYQTEQFAIIDIPRIRDYKNLEINNCEAINVSRTAMKSKSKNISTDALIQDLSWMSNYKVLFLTYLLHESEVQKKLDGSQLYEKNIVMVDHFGNLRGKNIYSDSNMIIMLGINRKSEAYYLAKALSMGLQVHSFERVYSKEGMGSKDNNINKLLYSDLFCDILQNTFRTALRKNNKQVISAYTFIKDSSLLNMLKEYFVNSKIIKWYPFNLCQQYLDNGIKHDRSIIELNKYLESKFSNESASTKPIVIEKQKIRHDLGYLNPKTLQNHFKNELIKETLKKLRVGVFRKTLRKIY